MNNFSRTTVFFAALSMAGASMAAQQAAAPAPVTDTTSTSTPGVAPFSSSVAVTGKASVKQRYHLHPNEFLDYDYGYVLDNGQYLQMSRRVNRYYAQVRHEAKVEIYGQRPGVFKTENGAELVFTNDGADIVITGLDKMPGGRLTLTDQPAPSAAR